MKPLNYLLIILASLALQACGPDNNAKAKLFEEQRSALEKAKAVDSMVQQQTRDAQQSMEKQTQ